MNMNINMNMNMNMKKYIVLLALFVFGQAVESLAQVPITISKEIVKLNGVKMYAHGVKKGETVYSICRAYDVTAEDLQRYNPALADGLKEGAILYIPFEKNTSPRRVVEKPVRQENKAEKSSEKQVKYIEHKVEWYEDLDDIAAQYKVKKSVLKKLNNIKDETLKEVKTLKIPVPEETPSEPVRKVSQVPQETNGGHKTVALVLPLTNTEGAGNANYMDFYAGTLLAVNDLKAAGADITLNVIDQTPDLTAEAIMEMPQFKESDLIIGPVRSSSLSRFIEYSNATATPIVSPLDPSAEPLLAKGKYLFQAPLSAEAQIVCTSDMIEKLYRQYESSGERATITLIYQDGEADKVMAAEIARLLDEGEIGCQTICYNILQGKEVTDVFVENLKKDVKNIVAVLSNNEAFVSDAVRNIDILEPDANNVILCGTSKWKGFEALDINLFYKYNLHLVMPYYVDLAQERTKDFVRRFRALYNTEPSANAFSGYDVTLFFVGQSSPEGLQQNFEFRRSSSEGGFENTAATVIVYNPDYTITANS